MGHRHGHPVVPASRVSTLELFFDLVFVFAVTQLTQTLLGAPGVVGLGRMVVLLSALLWIYGAFAWLTNAAAPRSAVYRLALLVGMATFLVMALAVPHVFEGGELGFGLGYVAATLTHGLVFIAVGDEGVRRRMRTLLPRNLLIALAALAASGLTGTASTVAWLVFVALVVGAGVREDDSRFRLQPEHFAERMGLLVIVVLGESVVAVGVGASALTYDARLVLDALVGLALCAALWWCYFARDDEEIAEALAALPADRRSRQAMLALGYPFLPLLGGVVLVAAGLHEAVAHPGEHLHPEIAAYLVLGVASFLAGTVVVRVVLGLGHWKPRLAAAVVALLLAPVASQLPGLAVVAGLAALVAAFLVVEDRIRSAFRIPDVVSEGQDAAL